jgi:hypothetical protein
MEATVWMIPIDLAAWVREREERLIAHENAMFKAARDRATTKEERRYWDELLKVRAENAKKVLR